MMRVPLVMWMARNQCSEVTKNGALLISVELIPLQPDGYFSNLNIETQVHIWNSGWMWHTRTFPFPLPTYSLQFRIPRLSSCAQLAPWMGSQLWEEGGRGDPCLFHRTGSGLLMSFLSAEVRVAGPWAFQEGSQQPKDVWEKSSESLLCLPGRVYSAHFPAFCHLGLHHLPDFLCRLLCRQAFLVLRIAPGLGFGEAPKSFMLLHPRHIPFQSILLLC